MKICTKCGTEKPYEAFSKRTNARDGHQYECKDCKLEHQRNNPNRRNVTAKYRKANKDACNVRSIISQKKKREHYTRKACEWRSKNREHVNALRRNNYAKNPSTDIERVRRRIGKIKQFKLHPEYQAEVDGMYLFCSIFKGFEVDHIVPLTHDKVQGLHTPANLQVLTVTENRKKGNKYVID